MASISSNSGCQSTRLALAVSLVLVLFASTSPCAQAVTRPRPWSTTPDSVAPLSSVTVKFVNNLTQMLSVTVGSATPQSITLAPGASGVLPVAVPATLQFQIKETLYVDIASGQASVLGRLVAEVGELSVVVLNGPCATGQAGLTLVDYADGKLVNPTGCAVRQ